MGRNNYTGLYGYVKYGKGVENKMEKEISIFDGAFEFLSNFYLAPVEYEGITYCCSECAFQAAKTLNISDRLRLVNMAPGKAKREGRKVALRPNWELIKDNVMLQIVRNKFNQNPVLAQKLLCTGNAQLIEGNNWGDNYWGVCDRAKGKNKLGIILMQVREELRQSS